MANRNIKSPTLFFHYRLKYFPASSPCILYSTRFQLFAIQEVLQKRYSNIILQTIYLCFSKEEVISNFIGMKLQTLLIRLIVIIPSIPYPYSIQIQVYYFIQQASYSLRSTLQMRKRQQLRWLCLQSRNVSYYIQL